MCKMEMGDGIVVGTSSMTTWFAAATEICWNICTTTTTQHTFEYVHMYIYVYIYITHKHIYIYKYTHTA